MDTASKIKVKKLISSMPKGSVLITSKLKDTDYADAIIKKYKESGWLESIRKHKCQILSGSRSRMTAKSKEHNAFSFGSCHSCIYIISTTYSTDANTPI